jgi:hypothetical protein
MSQTTKNKNYFDPFDQVEAAQLERLQTCKPSPQVLSILVGFATQSKSLTRRLAAIIVLNVWTKGGFVISPDSDSLFDPKKITNWWNQHKGEYA